MILARPSSPRSRTRLMPPRPPARSRGFSLVEVMVALVVIAVGLLGIAKMQALALSSTSSASMRSLAAIEAGSLAAAMHADRDYWSATPPATVNVSGTTIDVSSLAATADCTSAGSAPCSASVMAAYDFQQWVAALNQLLPNPTAAINCETVTAPISCTIKIGWSENAVAINSQEASTDATNTASGTTAAFRTPTYTLYVEP
ncbi:MAG: type IV pilus modification protein PilV [Steroidobacteraceae bacterium]